MIDACYRREKPSLVYVVKLLVAFVTWTTPITAIANPPPTEKLKNPTAAVDNPFPDSPRDRGLQTIRGLVIGPVQNGQINVGIGYKSGILEGQFLNVSRAAKVLGNVEVVEVFEESCRCLTDLSLEVGDEVGLASPVSIRGRCIDENNNPIAGVTIALFRSSMNSIDRPSLVASSQTDGNGMYQLPPCAAIQLASYRTDLFVVAKKESYISMVENLNRDQEELSLKLSNRVASLVGIIRGPGGELVSGAQVRLHGQSSYIAGVSCTYTDDKGKYLLTDIAEWEENPNRRAKLPLIISHPEFGQCTAWYTHTPSMVNVRMPLPGIVQGKVIDQVTGESVRQAIVSAQGVRESAWYQTRTDNDGCYVLRMSPDKYNIWSEMNERVPIAVNSIEVIAGKTNSGADIQMVRGGVVYGKFLTQGKVPVKVENRTLIAHHGPARPISGAAVTTTTIASDGSFRLHVAPGNNYVYVMSHGTNASANIEIADGAVLELNLSLGDHRAGPQPVIRRALNLPNQAVDNFKPSRARRNTTVGMMLNKLEKQNSNAERYTDTWLQTIKDLVDLGKAAVPELCEELDATENDSMMRCLGFTLRAIGDPRAVPALIRAIPKTLVITSSDMGLRLPQGDLAKFAIKNQLPERVNNKNYGFGRSVREIFGALHHLTNVEMADEQLFHVFLQGTARQQSLKASLFHRQADKWATWWEEHADEFQVPPDFRTVLLKDLTVNVGPAELTPKAQYEIRSVNSGWILESATQPNADRVFLDIDTGRISKLPPKWRDVLPANLPVAEIDRWAIQEGFDIMGIDVPTTEGEPVYAIRNIGMQVWELDQKRWKMIDGPITLEALQAEGRAVDEYLFHEDNDGVDRFSKAPFLIITREGTPALLHVGVQVLDDSLKPGGISKKDVELDPIGFRKGRRFGFSFMEPK